MREFEESLMHLEVNKNDDTGEYEVKVTSVGGIANSWGLGLDEGIAKGKVQTIHDAYADALDHLQTKVVEAFGVAKDQEVPPSSESKH